MKKIQELTDNEEVQDLLLSLQAHEEDLGLLEFKELAESLNVTLDELASICFID